MAEMIELSVEECEVVAGGVGGYELPDYKGATNPRGGYISSSG